MSLLLLGRTGLLGLYVILPGVAGCIIDGQLFDSEMVARLVREALEQKLLNVKGTDAASSGNLL
jgi:hypothetical protein